MALMLSRRLWRDELGSLFLSLRLQLFLSLFVSCLVFRFYGRGVEILLRTVLVGLIFCTKHLKA